VRRIAAPVTSARRTASKKAVLTLATGRSAEDVAEILQIDANTVRNHFKLIERLWKFFKKKTLYNRYFETFDEFKRACAEFFRSPHKYHRELRTLLTPNFAIIG
jgi:hypothetical protein